MLAYKFSIHYFFPYILKGWMEFHPIWKLWLGPADLKYRLCGLSKFTLAGCRDYIKEVGSPTTEQLILRYNK